MTAPATTSTTAPASLGGVAILGPEQTALLKELDGVFSGWAVSDGAREVIAPPLYPVSDLEKFDVYKNFPHLALTASPIDVAHLGDGPVASRFASGQLQGARYGLPHAACYGAYLFHEGSRLDADVLVTLVNRCFRNETHYDGLRRLMSFQMREAVAIGAFDHTQQTLERFAERIAAFSDALGLGLEKVPATDPFFENTGARALLAKLSPVKYEFQYGDLAIASVNTHRNFFGERCRITLPGSDETAFTSCAAFGLERWVAVLDEQYGGDLGKALDAVRGTARQIG
ncbi:hypothetical protein ACFXAZ_19940 [Streptomyces sp. NPDC059477]|uniref:hypothetical protein n=1 Tax=Streptomyces sp. NPDC059477 TaxID=3346847 RepID=UPI0036B71B56